jgi:hypothetical protein
VGGGAGRGEGIDGVDEATEAGEVGRGPGERQRGTIVRGEEDETGSGNGNCENPSIYHSKLKKQNHIIDMVFTVYRSVF